MKSFLLRSMIFFATFKTLSAISIFIAEKLGLDIKIRPYFLVIQIHKTTKLTGTSLNSITHLIHSFCIDNHC